MKKDSWENTIKKKRNLLFIKTFITTKREKCDNLDDNEKEHLQK